MTKKLKAIVAISVDIADRKRAEESLPAFLADASASRSLPSWITKAPWHEGGTPGVSPFPRFADWCTVDMVEPDGGVRRLAVVHADATKVTLAHELQRLYPPARESPHGLPQVLRTGESDMMADIPEALLIQGAQDQEHLRLLQGLGLRSYMCVPLKARAPSVLGVVNFRVGGIRTTLRRPRTFRLPRNWPVERPSPSKTLTCMPSYGKPTAARTNSLATLAHELRNPLAPIRNALQILKMPRVDAATSERTTAMMERQVQHLVRLVDDLLDVSRVMRGKIELRKERVELASVVARAVEIAQPLIETQGHELNVFLPSESLPMNADPVRLAQVLGNLLTNAAKYTETNGRIWLTAEREGTQAILRVRDNGIGIAPDMLPHIFELFVQVDQAATRSQGGLGIGLTLVKNLVEMHRGTVEAQSAGLGQGSEFVLQLPLLALERREPKEMALAERQQVAPSPGHRLFDCR